MNYQPVILWSMFAALFSGVLSYALPGTDSENVISRIYLPGATTHGHYQIELKCGVCHDAMNGVKEDACIECHGAALKASRDTHPESKFRDPSNIPLLEGLDASSCINFHREHDPDRTHPMGVSVPLDYCYNCHEDIGEQRPSHASFIYDSCSTAGCHNYHDNTALYEKFLNDHSGEPDHLETQVVAARDYDFDPILKLSAGEEDSPQSVEVTPTLLTDWVETMHANAGVNCSACHQPKIDGNSSEWSSTVSMATCSSCHDKNVDGFLQGKHGMRLDVGLSPMTPGQARLPMHAGSFHRELSCNSCHPGHRFDTSYAAVEACLKCHADSHSIAYQMSSHSGLWQAELTGDGQAGSGVSCATCHMPRRKARDGSVSVEHNQNANLEPNEKMIRTVCMNCHGLQFSLNALADRSLIDSCYSRSPSVDIESVRLAKDWFAAKERARQKRLESRNSSARQTAPDVE